MNLRKPRRRNQITWIVVTVALLAGACSRSEPPNPDYAHILALAEQLEPAVVGAVASADSNALDDVVDAAGCEPILDCINIMEWKVVEASASPERFQEVKGLLLPYMEKMAAFLLRRYDCRGGVNRVGRLRTWQQPDAQAWLRLFLEFERTVADDSVAVEERLAWAVRTAPLLEAALARHGTYRVRDRIAHLHDAAGQHDTALRAWQEIIRLAAEDDLHLGICNYVGPVGSLHPDPDSTYYYWRLGLETARRHEFTYQEARLLSFIGSHYRARGRLSVAESYYTSALAVHDRHPHAPWGYRFQLEAADRYRQSGWYDEAEQAIGRAELMSERTPQWRIARHGTLAIVRAQRALLMLSQGDERRARAAREELLPELARHSLEFPTAFLLDYASEQIRLSDFDGCMETIGEGLALWPDNRQLDTYRRQMYARQAYVMAVTGRDAGAREALSRFESSGDSIRTDAGFSADLDERALVAVARARLEFHAEDADTAAVLDTLSQTVRAIIMDAEQGAHRYRWLSQNAFLRRLYDEVAGDDTELQLGLDFYWRTLHASTRRASREDPLVRVWRRYAHSAVAMAAAEDARILVYSAGSDGLIRYDVNPRRIERTRVDMPVPALRERVREIWVGLSAEPGRPGQRITPALAARLDELGRVLLPRELQSERVFIVADGFLSRLPFEALNVSRDGYVPLLERSEVVYLHGIEMERAARPGGYSVVLADPNLPPEVQRRVGRDAPLPGARDEAFHAAARLPAPRVATGGDATAAWLKQQWEGARYIHIATHVVDDPNVPYYSLMALAGLDAGGEIGDAFLDMGDVLDANLGACDLAVLSGCATGAPRARSGNVAPSFGDAFLDAGARAVVQTFWNVRDDVAAQTMRSFLSHWREEGLSPANALHAARRGLMSTHPHPYYWAAYSIEVNGEAR